MSNLVTRCMVCNAAIPSVPFYLAGCARVRCLGCQSDPAIEPGSLKKTPSLQSVNGGAARARKLAAARRKMEAEP